MSETLPVFLGLLLGVPLSGYMRLNLIGTTMLCGGLSGLIMMLSGGSCHGAG